MYHWQIEEVADIERSYQWLDKAGQKDRTEALIMAALRQALSTREAGVYHTRQDPCRLWKEASETEQHIVAGCRIQAGTAYIPKVKMGLTSKGGGEWQRTIKAQTYLHLRSEQIATSAFHSLTLF